LRLPAQSVLRGSCILLIKEYEEMITDKNKINTRKQKYEFL
ncbi:MAG: hypothetical protein RIR48_3379, partial [Bacteroidota bacterium]